MKKTRLIIILSIILLLSISIFGGLFFINIKPISKTENKVLFKIKEGQTPKIVFDSLKEHEIIKNSDMALIYSKLFKKPDFKAGDFEVDTSMDLNELIDYLSDENNIIDITTNFTILPGSTIKKIANSLSEVTNLDANIIINKWQDKQYIESLMSEYTFLTDEIFNNDVQYYLEGYLFPDTYNIYKETSVEAVTAIFLNNTKKYFDKYEYLFKSSNYSIHQLFTLASIVDYEARTLEDRKNVASAFYNRLEIGMRLQSSVTRCYARSIKENINITEWKECEFELDYYSPYDTYQIDGLPPSPIRCVSETSLQAVLEPNNTDYYYFVAEVCGDGTIYYANSLLQHNENIKRALSGCQ